LTRAPGAISLFGEMAKSALQSLAALNRVLADPGRLRILSALRGGELCVCQLMELLGLAASTTSQHLAALADVGLVSGRREGRWAWYRLAGSDAPVAVREAIAWTLGRLEGDPAIKADDEALRRILSVPPEELCKRQPANRGCSSSAPATRAAARWPKASRGRSGGE